MRLLWNYATEKPGYVLPGLALLALALILNLVLGVGRVQAPIDTPTLIRNENAIHVFLMATFGSWMVYGLVTGLRHGTVEWLRRLWPLPVNGPGMILGHRITAVLDPWVILIMPAFPFIFALFGTTASGAGLLIAILASGCLLHLCIGLVNIGESWANRFLKGFLVRFLGAALIGSVLLLPIIFEAKQDRLASLVQYLSVFRMLPTGVFLTVLMHLNVGNIPMALQATAPLIAYAIGVSVIEWGVIRRTLTAGRSNSGGHGARTTHVLGRADAVLSGLLPKSLEELGPFIAKDLVASIRYPQLWQLPFLMMIIVLTSFRSLDFGDLGNGLFIAAYGVMLCGFVAVNSFGLDRMGGVNYLMAPLTERRIMMGKHTSVWLVMMAQSLLTAICLTLYLPSGFPVVQRYTMIVFNLYLTMVAVSCGAIISLLFPRMMSSGASFGQRGVPATSVLALVICILVSAGPALILAYYMPKDGRLLASFTGLALIGLLGYRYLFQRSVNLLKYRREALFNALTVQENAL